MRRRDIQQHNLIRTRRRMTMCQFRRIARIDDIDKLNTLHHTPAPHIQASNNPLRQQSKPPSAISSKLENLQLMKSSLPLHLHKIAQNLQPNLSRLLRMKLDPHHIVAFHHTRKRATIMCN